MAKSLVCCFFDSRYILTMRLLEPFARYKAAKYSMTKSDLRQETSRPADLGWDYGCKPFPFTRFLSTVPLSTPFPATKQPLHAIIQRLWRRCYLIQWSMHYGRIRDWNSLYAFPAPKISLSSGWLGSRVVACWTQALKARVQMAVATLSGNTLRQTVHTRCASVHQASKLITALLRVAGVIAGRAENNNSLPPGLWLTSPAGWLPRTGISSGTLRSVIEYGLALP